MSTEIKRGRIVRWNPEKNYGWAHPITPNGGKCGPEIFMHANAGRFVTQNRGEVQSVELGAIMFSHEGVRIVDGRREVLRNTQVGDVIMYIEGKNLEDKPRIKMWTYEGLWLDFELELARRPLYRVVLHASLDQLPAGQAIPAPDLQWEGRDILEMSACYACYPLNGVQYDELAPVNDAFYVIEAFAEDVGWYPCADPRVELCCVPPAYVEKFTHSNVTVPNYCPHGTKHPEPLKFSRRRSNPRKQEAVPTDAKVEASKEG